LGFIWALARTPHRTGGLSSISGTHRPWWRWQNQTIVLGIHRRKRASTHAFIHPQISAYYRNCQRNSELICQCRRRAFDRSYSRVPLSGTKAAPWLFIRTSTACPNPISPADRKSSRLFICGRYSGSNWKYRSHNAIGTCIAKG
jgi:hypothetical protein